MSQHLNSQQLLNCLAGMGDAHGEQHARECAACRGEVENLRKPLEWFRASVHYVGERSMHREFGAAPVFAAARFSHRTFGSPRNRAGGVSVLAHVCVIALLFLMGTNKTVQQVVKEQVALIAPDLAPYKPAVKQDAMHGGGGGGDRSPAPVSKGKLPKLAQKQFVPPMITHVENPKLVMEPTLVMPPDTNIPKVNLDQLGDPLAKSGLASNGFGSGGGMGSGRGGGIGPGSGVGFGPGSGGGLGGGAYHIGGGVSAPTIIFKVEPEYSEEARKAKFQGTVVLAVVVDERGNPRDIRVQRPLGLGLDQKAVEAVGKWRFSPGKKDGKPVPVQAIIEVNFRLL
jgi:periplasmic protein TonB